MSRGLDRKEKIIKISTKHFANYGYEKTVLETIAKECNITKPAIYYYFKDKAELYQEILCSNFEALKLRVLSNTKNSSPIKAIESYIKSFGEFFVQKPEFSSIFAKEIAKDNSLMSKECMESLFTLIKRLSEILEQGNRDGVFEKQNPFMIQLMIVSTFTNYQTTKNIRKYIENSLKGENKELKDLNINENSLIKELTNKIIKGIKC